MTVRDFGEFMDYGLGINDTNGEIRGMAVKAPPPVEVPGTGGQTILFRLQKADTIAELHNATGLSLGGSASYGLFGGTEKFDFVESSNFHSYSLFLCVSITVTNTSKHILGEVLDTPGQTLLGQGTDQSNQRFREEFGDLFIKGIETGGEYFAIVEIETSSDEEKRDISNKLSAGGFFGAGGFDFASNFSKNFGQATSHESLKIVSFEKGGAGDGAKQQVDVGEVITKAQNFPKQVLAAPASFRVELQDYQSLDLPRPPNQVDLQNAKDVLQHYEDQRFTLLGVLNNINFIVDHPDQFESFNANDLGNLSDKVSSNLNQITASASQCLNDIKACKFVPVGVPEVSLLPKRKAGVVVTTGGTWIGMTPMPTRRNNLGLAAASNGKLYAAGGFNNVSFAIRNMEEYDPPTNSWATKAPIPLQNFDSVAMVSSTNGKLYAFTLTGDEVAEYDPATNIWTPKASVRTVRIFFGVAAASNGKLYALGGRITTPTPTPPFGHNEQLAIVEEYDPATNSWTTKKPMPTAREGVRAATATNGKLYAIGAGPNTGGVEMVEEYDPATDNWSTKAPVPNPAVSVGGALAAASNGKLYIVGGVTPSSGVASGVVQEYDPATNSWATKTPMLTPRQNLGLAATPNGKLYAVGGHLQVQLTVTYFPTVEEYTP